MKHKAMQRQIYRFIVQCVKEQGYPPSVREIGDAVGLKSHYPDPQSPQIEYLYDSSLIDFVTQGSKAIIKSNKGI